MPLIYFESHNSQALLSFDFWKVGNELRITEAKRSALKLAELMNKEFEIGTHGFQPLVLHLSHTAESPATNSVHTYQFL